MPEDLTVLPHVDSETAEELRGAGFNSHSLLCVATADELAAVSSLSERSAEDAIRAARGEANSAGFTSGTDLVEREKEEVRLTTGIQDLDENLRGGIKTGALTHVHGSEGSGRSRLMHQLAVRAHLPTNIGGLGGRAVYFDTRDAFDTDLFVSIVNGLLKQELTQTAECYGVESEADAVADEILNRLLLASPGTVEEQIEQAEQLKSTVNRFEGSPAPVRLVVIDSIMLNFNVEYPPDKREYLAEQRQLLYKHLHSLEVVADEYDLAVVYTNSRTTGGKPYAEAVFGHSSFQTLSLNKTSGEMRHIEVQTKVSTAETSRVGVYPTESGFDPE
jgi:DNA repair protein RadA